MQSLAWFVPGWLAVAVAALSTHPVVLIPLLLANALTMAAVCHAIGFDPEPGFGRTVLRRGAAHLLMFSSYVALVFLLVALPLLWLSRAPSLGAALLLAAALVVALGVLWRLWPTFGLVFVWDDAYPPPKDSSWLLTAVSRSAAFARHLAHEERFFSHFLPSAGALLVLAMLALTLTGMYGLIPAELRMVALVIYGLVLLPAGCLLVANRTVQALLRERHRPQFEPAPHAAAAAPAAVADAPVRAPLPPLSAEERTAGTQEQAAALLRATREGDIERALELVAAGADPDTAPQASDRDQRPVLLLAALLPDTRLLRALISGGADVNRSTGGLTALLAATRDSRQGRAEAVMTLLANGANPLAADAVGDTALHGAALSEEPTVAAMLLDADVPINALNRAAISPLACACRSANWPLAKFLLERGAKPNPGGGEPALVIAAGPADDDPQGVRLLLKQRTALNVTDGRRRSALAVAAAEGHEQIAAVLLAAGADPGLADQHGSTALMEAARAGAVGIVQKLAQAQPDVHQRDQHGRDALTLACQSPRAHADTIRALLALGADPKCVAPDGRSALDHAAAAGRWDLVGLLDPHRPLPASLSDDTPGTEGPCAPDQLLHALRGGQWTMVSNFAAGIVNWPQARLASLYMDLTAPGLSGARRWMLEHGLQAEARLHAPPVDDADTASGEPAARAPLGQRLFDAILPQLPAATEALDDLLQAGANPAGAGLLAQILLQLGEQPRAQALALDLLNRGADPFGADPRLRTPLHLAARFGHVELMQELLQRGCDPNVRDARHRTPLFDALGRGESALGLVRALIAHGADPEASDANGETPLGMAQEHAGIKRWLDWGESTGNRPWSHVGRSLRAHELPAAAAAGALTAVQRLLELGFAVDARDAQGATALLHACGAGHQAIAELLLNADADPALAADSGMTALAVAVAARRDALVALVLPRGVEVDQRLPGGTTALMLAAAMGYPELVERLLHAGADLAARDSHGRQALHAAAQFAFETDDSLRARRLFDTLLRRQAPLDQADQDGTTPLLLLLGALQRPGTACDATHLGALVPVLLDAGAPLQHADGRGVTALHACAMHALLPAARVLLARGADRQAVDSFGRTAADVARQLGYVDIAHELAARGGSAIPSVRQTLRQPAQPSE